MSMTAKDRVAFDRVMAKIQAKSKKLKGVGELADYINTLEGRVSDLEKLVVWCMFALAGEGYFTPELREATKLLGFHSYMSTGGVQ